MKFLISLSAACALLLTSCQDTAFMPSAGARYAFARSELRKSANSAVSDGAWDVPPGLTGPHLIVIDTELQQAKYFINGRQVGWSTISSGKNGHLTPHGTFKVLSKDIDKRSNSYGSIVDAAGNVLIENYTQGQPIPAGGRYQGAAMNFGMQLTNYGIWMHEGIVTSAPESHGCIRLPRHMAQAFFENTPVGTPVIIK